jgi:NAD(P) transhydrogenase subunit alpha
MSPIETQTIYGMYVFMLSAIIGYYVIHKVPPLLHTPLMAATNAISAIAVVGALLVTGASHSTATTIIGTIAIASAVTNVVGGFLITDRMLKMFNSKKKGGK